MANSDTGLFSCRNTSWIVGGLLGLAAFLLILPSWLWAIIAGIVIAVVVALVLQKLFCSDAPATSGVGQTSAATPAAKTSAPAKADVAADEKAAEAATSAGMGNPDAAAVSEAPAMNADAADASAETPKAAPKPKGETVGASDVVTPSKELPGQKELSERKGDYKYEKPADAASAKKPAAKKPAAKSTAKASAGPELLSGPREGGADDLKMIKGVGPGIEKKLNDAGVYHFDQIASWKKADIATMDDKLSFRGRIERDGWIKQAKSLAKGEQTEFSKRASSSGLYEGNKKK
ncbi:MAG TPA: hypothetical protein DEO85_10885 [Maritimibacter sp.]|nr:hypothetical protein [Maritimibacter sp.]